MTSSIRHVVFVLLALMFVGVSTSVHGQPLPIVRIMPWEQAANGTGVVFKTLTPTQITEPSAPLSDETADGHFEYALDTSDIKWSDDCRCFRYYVVTVRSKQTGIISRHKIKASPSGSFEDQRVQVRLTISEANPSPVSDGEDISLPVASAPTLEPGPLVVVQTREPMGSVALAGVSEIQIELRNPSKHMAMQVPSDFVVMADQNNLWKQPARIEGRGFPLTLAPNAVETFRLRLQPNTWEAIQKSFIPTNNDKPHTAMRIKVPYTNSVFGQRDGWTESTLLIRFRPSILSLIVALACGVTLGSLVPFFSKKSGSIGRWSRATATALVAAIVLELVGMFMVANNSKFIVFSFDLDPWQTLPVLLLGIGNGLLGLEAARRLRFVKDQATS